MISQPFRPPWPVLSLFCHRVLEILSFILTLALSPWFFSYSQSGTSGWFLFQVLFLSITFSSCPISLHLSVILSCFLLTTSNYPTWNLVLAVPDVVWTLDLYMQLGPSYPIWNMAQTISLFINDLQCLFNHQWVIQWCINCDCDSFQPIIENPTLAISPIPRMILWILHGYVTD